jgi:acetyl-CoA carboxylase biotin carboxyl carrier protein
LSLNTQEIKEILAILDESGWDDAEVTVGDLTLKVSKGAGGLRVESQPRERPTQAATGASEPTANGSSAAPADSDLQSAAPPAALPAATEPSGVLVSSPSIGVFWRSPEPGAPPFVEVGASVEAGETLCIVEVMKLMQQVTAEVSGTVTQVHAENGGEVEFGTALFTIVPSGS